MDIINLLPENIANQIAAGEVIQRPSSVVKELIENSIDSGALNIDVNIKDAGKTLIQVVDDGKGMSSNDAEKCFKRHATSKIKTANDLYRITTKGFRGEALASISAISHVEMKTRTENQETGTLIFIKGSNVEKREDVVCPIGTSFEIKNLFFNVPARRNFLKKESTEFKHIQDEFIRIALSHPEINLTLTHNGAEIFNLHPSVLRKRIINLYTESWNDRLVPIEESTEIASIKGFVVKPEHTRRTRGDQFFFINNRFFKSSYFNHAITKAFEGLIKKENFPGYFIYMEINTKKIDINVHPTKTEIKFEEEKYIYSILLSTIKRSLGKYNITPTIDFDRESSFDIPNSMLSRAASEPIIKVNSKFNPFKTKENLKGITNKGFGTAKSSSVDWDNFYSIDEEKENITENYPPIDIINSLESFFKFLIKDSYIITPSKSGLMIIHARRAIEQITYSETLKSMTNNCLSSQELLFPLEKEVSINEINIWKQNYDLLKKFGYRGIIKKNLLTIQSVPSILQEESISQCIDDILDTLEYKEIDESHITNKIILSIAKSTAMKKLNLNTNKSIQALVDKLFQCENHTYSPRGKKIIETISLKEIEDKLK